MKSLSPDYVNSRLAKVLGEIQNTYDLDQGINNIDGSNLPTSTEVIEIMEQVMQLFFPGFYTKAHIHKGNLEYWSGELLDEIYQRLVSQVAKSLAFQEQCSNRDPEIVEKSKETTLKILEAFPKIRSILKTDIRAAYAGDPAATCHNEIIMSYPGIRAIAMYRVAHEFYKESVPLIPRIISEYAHEKTGVDIHPGAKIGSSFFIDHGTGVVVGETAEIGDNVKIYQLVTIGALSFQRSGDGALVRGGKRHPTIEDNVVLYAGCTILGGGTTIGKGSVIGGNVWITQSVDPQTIITFDVNEDCYRIKLRKAKGLSQEGSDCEQKEPVVRKEGYATPEKMAAEN